MDTHTHTPVGEEVAHVLARGPRVVVVVNCILGSLSLRVESRWWCTVIRVGHHGGRSSSSRSRRVDQSRGQGHGRSMSDRRRGITKANLRQRRKRRVPFML